MIALLYGLSLLCVGMFAGLIMTLIFIMQKQWLLLSASEYAFYFKGFLKVAKGNWLVSILTFVSFLGPWAISVVHFVDGDTTTAWLAVGAGFSFFIGSLLVTLFLNFPIYDKVMNWEKPADVDKSQTDDVRTRFFILNIVRLSSSLVTFILLFGALLHEVAKDF